MGEGAGTAIDQGDRFEVDGLEFVPSWYRPSQPGSLTLLKGIHMVELYQRLLAPFPNPRMVELGISQGGSVGLLALLAQPEKFVAIELATDPVVPLLDALAERGLSERVKPYFGVDQADQARLAQIVADEFGGAPLDLVIDDASHRYDQTVASFEVLFPRLRPGGVFVIEDWTGQDHVADHAVASLTDPESPRHEQAQAELARRLEAVLSDPTAAGHDAATKLLAQHLEAVASDPASPHHEQVRAVLADEAGAPAPIAEPRAAEPAGTHPPSAPERPPVSRIALELALACAVPGNAVADVHLDENWITVRRGEGPLDPATFRMGDLYPDHFRLLTAFPEPS